ncbi:toxin [Bacillus cereus]|nr:toxin [Bacillus cereus]
MLKKGEFTVSTTENNIGVFQLGTNRLTAILNQSGYKTVFDIASESLSEFEKNNPEIPSSDAKEIFKLAVIRTENLRMLYKAWQLHNDPIVKSIPKLSSNTGTHGMRTALKRSLGGGADFEDLFPERSPEGYAESTSIQSLFSPGRYLTVLYKIAQQLHNPENKLHIDNRRPDLKSLILSEDNMNTEVSSLDILLDVLQPDGFSTLESLKDTYYPMTLPYDDDLTQINAVAKSHSTNLLGIWDTLLDTQRGCILQDMDAISRISKKCRVSPPKISKSSGLIAGEEFYLEAKGKRLYFANVMKTDSSISVHITLGNPQAAAVVPAKFKLIYDIKSSGYYLRVANGVLIDEMPLQSCFLTNDNGEHTGTKGPYCLMKTPGYHLPVEIERLTDTSIRIFVPRTGYLGLGETVASHWENPLALNLNLNEALSFTLKKNETGDETISVSEVIPPVADTTPSPSTRELISLTPNSFRLLVNPDPSVEDITNHYNIKNKKNLDYADLAAILNNIDNFCQKTSLNFNELLQLTMQKDYQIKSNEYKSRFLKFGSTQNVPVSTYGAVFLTGTEEIPLWVKQYKKLVSEADAYVCDGKYAGNNYGSEDRLVVKRSTSDFNRNSYIRFDLSSLSEVVEQATISLTSISARMSVKHQAQLVNDISWNESKITWNNKPVGKNIITTWEVTKELSFVNFDVTQQVNDALKNGKKRLSLMISSVENYGNAGGVTYASKEHAMESYRPYLKVAEVDQPTTLNFKEENVVALAGRAEKLVRLARNTGLSFEQLDWLITNASKAIFEHGKKIILDRTVLGALAEFTRLNKNNGITSDMFAAFIGEINTYAEEGKQSFYQDAFSNIDGTTTIPLGASLQFAIDKQGLYESICCGAMGVTADEFARIGAYCFGDTTQQITVDETSIAQLYRLGKIPQMLGLSFGEAELLWKTMDGGKDTLLRTIGANPRSLQTLDIIRCTEVLLQWMDAHQLDVVSLQAMVTSQYSGTATPELYNFLAKVYQSIIGIARVSRENEQNDLPVEKIYHALATEFHLKANVMAQIVNWIDKTNLEFTSKDFWNKIQWYFSTSHGDKLTALEGQVDLLKWCQKLSQYVLIVRWCGLNEQELTMMIEHPEQLLNGYDTVPKPSIHLLLVLSRLKEWELRVQVSSDEALCYFAQVNTDSIKTEGAVKLLAHIHGWNEDDTASMNNYLLGMGAYPKNFEQVFTLESWFNLGKQLNVGSRTLGELVELSEENNTAESTNLITSVAQSLMASMQSRVHITKTGGKEYV